jgi:murein tripeptide amidase MpaA
MRSPYDARNLIGWLTQNGYDVAGFNWREGSIEVITDQEGIQRLQTRNLRGVIRQQMIAGRAMAGVDPNYLNPQKVEDSLKALAARFPGLTRLEQIGTSIEGRPIWALLVSSTPKVQDPAALEKPSMIFDGMHHAREIMTPEIVLDVAQTLLGAVQNRSRAAMEVVDRWNIWVVPMLNVDGNNMVWSKDTWWRKNTHATQARVHGVDINRN